MITRADVTICIPTYRSREFIDRTLRCARAQTYANVRIIVSIDACDDGTEDVCRRQAGEDRRVEVLVQPQRLGWSQNANAALAPVTSDFFFVYFHDDVIEPTYVTTLRDTLLQHPEAASAHCDLVEFGLLDEIKPAHTYEGSTLHRLVDFMMTNRGTTLRSLVRRAAFKQPLRFPVIHGDNHWTAWGFHLALLAAGPAIGVPRALYRRWQREGSLTRSEGWAPRSVESLLQGQRESAEHCSGIFRAALSEPDEVAAAEYCLALFHRLFVRAQQLRLRSREGVRPSMLAETRSGALNPGILAPEAEAWVRGAEERVAQLERELLAL